MTPPKEALKTDTNIQSYQGKAQFDNTDRAIFIDLSRDAFFNEVSLKAVKDKHLFGDEVSPQEALARACCAFSDDSAHAQRMYEYASHHWFKFPTPVLANGGTERGQPINCFLNQVDDSRQGLGEHYAENLWLSTSGGGIGTDWSNIRSVGTSTSKGNKTTGIVPFIKVVDSLTVASWQGSTRRGATAVYLSVSHPEIEEFVEIRKPTGDGNRRSHNIHNAVSIPDAFMEAVEEGSKWDLIDPHTNEKTSEINARDLWMKILSLRASTGEPYLYFTDTANRALPQHLKDKGLKINHTNLCTEIMLPTNPDRTAVCCLSSVNLEYYDEWKDSELFIEDMLRMLDNILETFIQTAPDFMWRAIDSARKERSVGLGALGLHTFLQTKGVPWESAVAISWDRYIFKHIHDKAHEANLKLGKEKGEAPDAEGTGLRFSHTMAVAPNASATIYMNSVSPSIEPLSANAFTHKTHLGVFLVKNKVLENLLVDKYAIMNKDQLNKVWQQIILEEGSVQNLNILPNGRKFDDEDKAIFKTAMELDQQWIIEHAGARQEFIDQGQSINLFIRPDISKGAIHKLHKSAWEKGLKSLYYCRSASVGKTEKITDLSFNLDKPKETPECLSCEG